MGHPRAFLFIFDLFKQLTERKMYTRTRIVGVEGEHANHLTTTALKELFFC